MTKNLIGAAGVMQTSENKIAFFLNLIEPLIVNDLNNEIALAGGIVETFVALIKTQETARPGVGLVTQQPPLKAYVKFALRCLTSAIRTEAAVARVRSPSLITASFSFTGSTAASPRCSRS